MRVTGIGVIRAFAARSCTRERAIVAWALFALLRAAATQAEPLAVVAAESVYGDIVRQIGGPDVAVVSILANPDQDPHAFEASTSTATRIARARLVVYNGADYDAWIVKLLTGSPSRARVAIDVAALTGRKPGDNPHLWYDPAAIDALARALAATLTRLDDAQGAQYAQRLSAFEASMQPLRARIEALRRRYAGTPVTATEPVFGYMADALGLAMRHARFQLAVMNGAEPSARDVAAFERDLRTRAVKALIVNRQTTSALTQRVRDLARESGVPIVEVTETKPPDRSYQQWMLQQLDALERALARS